MRQASASTGIEPRAVEDDPSIVWTKTYGGSRSDYGQSIAVCPDGNLVIGGYKEVTAADDQVAFIAKYSPDGVQLWNTYWGGAGSDQGYAVAVDAAGNPFLAGRTTTYGAGAFDAFIAKFSTDGTLLWNHTWGGPLEEECNGIAVDAGGNAYIGGITEVSMYSYDAFIVKYAANGTVLWDRKWGGSGADSGHAVAADAGGNAYLVGDTFSFGTASSADAFIVKYAQNGTQLWNATWGGADTEYGWAVVTSGGDPCIVGSTASFGAGASDGFIVKYDTNGMVLWERTWGGASFDNFLSVAAGADGTLFLTGPTSSYSSNYDLLLVTYDADGTQLANLTWGLDTQDDRGKDVVFSAGYCYTIGSSPRAGTSYTDAVIIKFGPTVPGEPFPWWIILLLIVAAIAIIIVAVVLDRKRKKRGKEQGK